VLGNKIGSAARHLKRFDDQLKSERARASRSTSFMTINRPRIGARTGSVDGVLNTVPTLSRRAARQARHLRDDPGRRHKNYHGYAFRKEDTELAALDSRITDESDTASSAHSGEVVRFPHGPRGQDPDVLARRNSRASNPAGARTTPPVRRGAVMTIDWTSSRWRCRCLRAAP